MINRPFKLTLLLLFLAQITLSQNYKIVIKGNNIFRDVDYRKNILLPADLTPKELQDSVKDYIARFLSDNGYFNFNIDSIRLKTFKQKPTEITVFIREGKPTIVKGIDFNGLSKRDSVNILIYFNRLLNKPFIQNDLAQSINDALRYYENNGFPFASISIPSVQWHYSKGLKPYVKISLSLKKGNRITIDSIAVDGNNKTKAFVIKREFRNYKNALYSKRKIDNWIYSLNRLNLFSFVSKPVLLVDETGKGILKITVKEKNQNSFDGIIGYAPPATPGGKGYFTGYLNLVFRNIIGTGRAFNFRWLQENKYSREIELNYLEPWLLDFPLNLRVKFYQRKQDTTFVKQQFKGEVQYLYNRKLNASIMAGINATIPNGGNTGTLNFRTSTSYSTGIKINYDSRNNIYAPSSGSVFVSSYEYYSKTIEGSSNKSKVQKTSLQKIYFTFAFYYEVYTKNVLNIRITGKQVSGNNLDPGDLFYLGGFNSIRGYRENQFMANSFIFSNLEYHYLLSNKSFVFLFFDNGYFSKNLSSLPSIAKQEKFLQSYGLGFSLNTSLGILKISYAVAKGSSLSDGYIHFGIFNIF